MAEEETIMAAARKTPPGGLWYRYRYIVIGLLTANAGMAAYWLLTREQPKVTVKLPQEIHKPEAEAEAKAEQPLPITVPPVDNTPAATLDVAVPETPKARKEIKQEIKQEVLPKVEAKPEKPVSKNDQVEVYKWMLSEKRKVKPSSSEEKARIDLEKAILKDYIRGKVPSL